MTKGQSYFLAVFGAFIVVCGLFSIGKRVLWTCFMETTEGTVTSSMYVEEYTKRGQEHKTYVFFTMDYQYFVDGTKYIGKYRVGKGYLENMPKDYGKYLKDETERSAPGGKIKVYYMSLFPGTYSNYPKNHFYWHFSWIVFFLFGVVLLVIAVKYDTLSSIEVFKDKSEEKHRLKSSDLLGENYQEDHKNITD